MPKSTNALQPSKTAAFDLPLTATLEGLIDKGSDHQFRQTMYDLDFLAGTLIDARKLLGAAMGVSSPQYNILMIVAEYDSQGGITVRDVAQRLHVSGAFVTIEASRLTKERLVRKRPNPKDKRSVLLHMTPEGGERIRQLIPSLQRFNNQLFQDVSKDEFQMMSSIVARLIANCEEAVSDYQRTSRHARKAALLGP